MTTLSRSDRLDRLPFTALHRRILGVAGVGWALDAMDVGLISFVMAALAEQWTLSPGTLSWIGAVGFMGMALGASFGGGMADRVGRRAVFAGTLLVYGLATGAAAFSWSVASLLVFRFLIGLGLGAELPVASTLVSEFAPARIRGRVVVLLEAFWAVGWILAALIGTLVIPLSDQGWRWAFVLGAVPAFYSAVVRRTLPESVRFLEGKGRTEEAEATVRRFESAAGIAPPAAAPAPVVPPEAPGGVGTLWEGRMRRRTLGLWLAWFGINFAYYGAFIWLPTLLVSKGFSLVRSFEFTLWMTLAQLPGYAVAAYLIEKWGRRPTLALFLAGSAVSAVFFGASDAPSTILASGALLSFFNLGAWGALYAVPGGVPHRPPRHRGGVGGGVRPHRLHPGAALRPPAPGRGGDAAGLRSLLAVLRRRHRGLAPPPRAARAPPGGPTGGGGGFRRRRRTRIGRVAAGTSAGLTPQRRPCII